LGGFISALALSSKIKERLTLDTAHYCKVGSFDTGFVFLVKGVAEVTVGFALVAAQLSLIHITYSIDSCIACQPSLETPLSQLAVIPLLQIEWGLISSELCI